MNRITNILSHIINNYQKIIIYNSIQSIKQTIIKNITVIKTKKSIYYSHILQQIKKIETDFNRHKL
jgi:hypothetical protein